MEDTEGRGQRNLPTVSGYKSLMKLVICSFFYRGCNEFALKCNQNPFSLRHSTVNQCVPKMPPFLAKTYCLYFNPCVPSLGVKIASPFPWRNKSHGSTNPMCKAKRWAPKSLVISEVDLQNLTQSQGEALRIQFRMGNVNRKKKTRIEHALVSRAHQESWVGAKECEWHYITAFLLVKLLTKIAIYRYDSK